MANTKLLFYGSLLSDSSKDFLDCKEENNHICITITQSDCSSYIYLDKSTAIKFQREIKKQISYIETEGNAE